jgi:hypothetical protein
LRAQTRLLGQGLIEGRERGFGLRGQRQFVTGAFHRIDRNVTDGGDSPRQERKDLPDLAAGAWRRGFADQLRIMLHRAQDSGFESARRALGARYGAFLAGAIADRGRAKSSHDPIDIGLRLSHFPNHLCY